MRVLVTGADGFIGRNLMQHLRERAGLQAVAFTRADDAAALAEKVAAADVVVHLAGVNRPRTMDEFATGNALLTRQLCEAAAGRATPLRLIVASTVHVSQDTPYGASKRAAEDVVMAAAAQGHVDPYVFRLPNVFGKWCRPNYNSAVATFCHNIARGLPIQVNDPAAPLSLVYVDDVVAAFLAIIDGTGDGGRQNGLCQVQPVHATTVGAVAEILQSFAAARPALHIADVGTGFLRALYATYISYLPPDAFSYAITRHEDPRGVFMEMLKTPGAGQFSVFTAHPGVTRGGHYHHTKSEKFLVVKGVARFRFRNMADGQAHELVVRGEDGRIVDTAPGWAHDITNTGDSELVVMLWANEVFDPAKPDTFATGL